MKVLCIIQARMGSTRLPGKVLFKLCNKPVILHVIDRVKSSKLIDDIVVATSLNINNLPLVKTCVDNNISVYSGSEDDVLDRYYQVSKILEPMHIVRITADCPVIDPDIVDKVIKSHLEGKNDYTSNSIVDTYPDGLNVEVFTKEATEVAWKHAFLNSEREHVTPFLYKPENGFKIRSIINDKDLSDKRWTLDVNEDYVLLQFIFDNLYSINNTFNMYDILDLLSRHKEIESINSMIQRNEGYQKSLYEDNLSKKRNP